jgi:AP-1 complex subunit beta-1
MDLNRLATNVAPASPAPALQFIEDETLAATLARKLAPPLVTLLGAEPELQYVALRNINLIISAKPGVLANDVKV